MPLSGFSEPLASNDIPSFSHHSSAFLYSLLLNKALGPFFSYLLGVVRAKRHNRGTGKSVCLAECKREHTILWSIYFHLIHSQGYVVFASLIFCVH